MKRAIDNRDWVHGRQIVLVTALVLVTGLRPLSGQQKEKLPPGYDPPERAHRHNSNMSCCAPCAPETNRDRDVFKRPCFVRALAKARVGFHTYHAWTGPDGIEFKVPGNPIPPQSIEGFQSILRAVIQADHLPRAWNDVEFYVPYPVKTVTEVRNGVRMLVGHKVYRGSNGGQLQDGDPIHTAWTVGSIELLPLSWHRTPPSRGVLVRLRLHGDERLELGQRPENFTRSAKDFEAFFNRSAFHALLVKVFRVPFDSPDDFLVSGFDTEYEGVRVFHGQIRSRQRSTQLRADRSQKPAHWWDEMRLLVTDSAPQYFCVQIILRENDKAGRSER